MEADDAQGIEQWAKTDRSTCIVTIDKDLNMIPGWHYNFVKDEFKYWKLSESNRFFWWQMLVGDRTDNIPGIDKIGPVRADKLLDSTKNWKQVVENEYKRQYGEGWHLAFDEVARLLWILREEDKTYSDYL